MSCNLRRTTPGVMGQSSFTGDGNIQRESMEAAPQLKASGLEGGYRSTDYDLCFNSAQKILKKYRKMLNSYTSLTGVSLLMLLQMKFIYTVLTIGRMH